MKRILLIIIILFMCMNFAGCKKEESLLQLQQNEKFHNNEVNIERKETKEFKIEFGNFDTNKEFEIIYRSIRSKEDGTVASEVITTLPIKGKVTSADQRYFFMIRDWLMFWWFTMMIIQKELSNLIFMKSEENLV